MNNVDAGIVQKSDEIAISLNLAPAELFALGKAKLNAALKRIAKTDKPRTFVLKVIGTSGDCAKTDKRARNLI